MICRLQIPLYLYRFQYSYVNNLGMVSLHMWFIYEATKNKGKNDVGRAYPCFLVEFKYTTYDLYVKPFSGPSKGGKASNLCTPLYRVRQNHL